MPIENARDPRTRLVREKYFSLRPRPLERWLWQQGLPQTAERVFWLHWEEGMKSGDWCSQLPLKRVAAQCCIDPSTVTRAYQRLRSLDLIRRQDPGRDPDRPFQQATAITEVRLPRAFLAELQRSPNRRRINELQSIDSVVAAPVEAVAEPLPSACKPSREQIQATWRRTSSTERARYYEASRNGCTRMAFDPGSQLTDTDRLQLLNQLEQMARARSSELAASKSVQNSSAMCAEGRALSPVRRLSSFLLGRARARLLQVTEASLAGELWRQIVWSVEEGALSRFEPSLALNIAVKKVRDGAWTRPNRMPPNWARHLARAEPCAAA
jgi:hypothetical protein